jgi:hypothetical protein
MLTSPLYRCAAVTLCRCNAVPLYRCAAVAAFGDNSKPFATPCHARASVTNQGASDVAVHLRASAGL